MKLVDPLFADEWPRDCEGVQVRTPSRRKRPLDLLEMKPASMMSCYVAPIVDGPHATAEAV
jgi:hypothetical protein